jgi:hypothetical protein
MNRQSKSAIKSLVLTLRRELEADIATQLKRHGFAGERWIELDRLPHTQRDDQATIDYSRFRLPLLRHPPSLNSYDLVCWHYGIGG